MAFGRSSKSGGRSSRHANPHESSKGPVTWDVPIFFGIMFALSIAELFFTIDSFHYLSKMHQWSSSTERARLAFLIFSSARTICLAAVYTGFHCAQRFFHSMLHTIFLVISTILWVISGVLIHQMWGYIECENTGIADDLDMLKNQLAGGLTECHELKIIEIIAWVLAGVSVLATIPVVMNRMKQRKARAQSGKTRSRV